MSATSSSASSLNQSKSGLVVFLHGSGGDLFGSLSSHFSSHHIFSHHPHLSFFFPSAPNKPYTLFQGEEMPIWFDRKDLSPSDAEDLKGIQQSADWLQDRIEKEKKKLGLKGNERVVIGGFSMGGGMALYYTYEYYKNKLASENRTTNTTSTENASSTSSSSSSSPYAGCITAGAFLSSSSSLPRSISTSPLHQRIPLLMMHGEADSTIKVEWGKSTYQRMKESGAGSQHRDCSSSSCNGCEWKSFPDLFHEMDEREMKCVDEFLRLHLPPI